MVVFPSFPNQMFQFVELVQRRSVEARKSVPAQREAERCFSARDRLHDGGGCLNRVARLPAMNARQVGACRAESLGVISDWARELQVGGPAGAIAARLHDEYADA